MLGEIIGKRVRELRLARGMSLRQLASRIGMSHATIQKLEKGSIPDPGIETVLALAGALGVAPNELQQGEAVVLGEARADYSVDGSEAQLWRRFARAFKAGDPIEFISVMESLPKSEQAMVSRIARLLAIESRIG